MGKLRDRMTADLTLAGYSKSTCEVYLNSARQFVAYFGRSPEEMGGDEVRAYLLHLIEDRKLSKSSLDIARAALKFLYGTTLDRPIEVESIPVMRQGKRLPKTMTGTEIEALLDAVRSDKYRLIISAMYAGGMRISEACALRVGDIDSKRMVIRIVGKGDKERLTVLSGRLLAELRTYWATHRPGADDAYFFPGNTPGNHISAGSVRTVFNDAVERAGIRHKVTPHSLRHSFATHLIDMGVDVTMVKVLLGHASLRCTERYVHASTEQLASTRSPLDVLGTDEGRVLR